MHNLSVCLLHKMHHAPAGMVHFAPQTNGKIAHQKQTSVSKFDASSQK